MSKSWLSTLSSRKGFSLIELLVFAVIFAGLMIAFISVLVAVTSIQARQSSVAEVNQQSQFLLQQIQQLAERSSLIEIPQDTVTSTLKLRMPASAEDPTYITLSNGIVYLQQGAGAQNALTSNRVNVSTLNFTKHSNPPGHDSVAVSFLVAYNNLSVKQKFSETLQMAIARVSAATFDSNVIPSSTATFDLGVSSQIWRSVNNLIYFSGSNVGIGSGASSPGSQLDLAGAQTFRGMSVPATSSAGQATLYYDSSANQLKLSQNAGAYSNLGGGPWNTNGAAVYYNGGNVGIGTTNPGYQLELSTDSAGKPGGGSWSDSSDARIKTNVVTVDNALNTITQLRGVKFDWINPKDHDGQTSGAGFIAQEVEKVFPNWVDRVSPGPEDAKLTNGEKIRSLTLPFEFDAYVVNALKELNDLALKVKDGVARVGHIVADFVETQTLKAEYIVAPHGITTQDAVTGQPYCMRVANGQVQALPGECP